MTPRTQTHIVAAVAPRSGAHAALSAVDALLIAQLIWWLVLIAALVDWAMPWGDLGWSPPALASLAVLAAAAAGGLVIVAELALAALRLMAWGPRAGRGPATRMRVRTPSPQSGAGAPVCASDGGDLWHAAHRLLPQHSAGGAWVAMTIGARPDSPAELGVLVGGGSARQHRAWVDALRQLVVGHQSAAVVDAPPDPLARAIGDARGAPGACLAWGDLLLRHGPEHPLRTPDACATDLAGPLIALIRPRLPGIRYAEAQVAAQPRHDWLLSGLGWRARAHHRLQRLRSRSGGEILSLDARALERKLAEPCFDVLLRVAIVAEGAGAAREMLRAVEAGLGQYAARSGQRQQRLWLAGFGVATLTGGRGALGWLRARRAQAWARRLVARAPRCAPPAPILLPRAAWRPPAALSSGELGGIWHLPTPDLAGLVAWLPARVIPAPAAAFADPGDGAARITLGHALRADGQLAPVGPRLSDLRTIMHLTAGMGAGKSRFLANLCAQAMPAGFLLIDGKGDDSGNLTASVRRLVPRADQGRVALLDISDRDWPVGLNPLAGADPGAPGAIDRAAALMQCILARLDPEGWAAAPGMQQFIEMGTRLVVEAEPRPTIPLIRRALTDPAYRAALLGGCRREEIRTFWLVTFPASSEQQRSSLGALMRRLDKLLLSDLLRLMVAPPRPTFRFDQAIAERLIVLCPIPHVAYGPLAATAATLIFQSFLRAAFERPGSATSRCDYPLVVDELQVLAEQGATQDVAVALTQLRSLGVPSVYAHQALAQIPDLRDLLMINAENRLLLRTQEPDASLYARHYAASGLTGADIAGQEPGEHQYARFVVDGATVGPFSIRPLPWPAPPDDPAPPAPTGAPDWRLVTPAPRPGDLAGLAEYDRRVAALAHRPYAEAEARRLAERLDDAEWRLLCGRWGAIAAAQRRHILAHPGCIADQGARVRWLSRLGYARPRLLAEAELLRAGRPPAA